MDHASKSLVNRLALVVTKRLASIFLPLGFGLGDFIGISKSAFVHAAADQIANRGHRPSKARIAALTGLSRAEVAKIRTIEGSVSSITTEPRTERVMYGWFTDPEYNDSQGNPRLLTLSGPASFGALVRKYSGDIPHRAVLEELLAGGMADVTASGNIRALRRHHVLASGRLIDDLEARTVDSDVFLRSALSPQDGRCAVRRVSVTFPEGVSLSVRRTVAMRTERFMAALADYLHASATDSRRASNGHDKNVAVLHVMITQCEIEGPK